MEDIKDTVNDTELNESEEIEEFVESPERTAFRRKRVKRIKFILIFLLIVFLVVPNIVCGLLLVKIYHMNRNIDSLREEIKLSKEEIERRTRESAAAKIEGEAEELDKASLTGPESLVQLHLTDEQKYPGKQLVYLTFDDGPSGYTDEILDILESHDAKGTFFVLAKEGYDEQYSRILEDGHTLGMHSYTHKYGTIYSSLDAYKEDVNSLSDFLVEKTGVRPTYYRFPGGSSNGVSNVGIQDMLHFLSDSGYIYYDWNVSSEDAATKLKETGTIVKNVLNGIGDKKKSVVLMHDSTAKPTTVEALPVIIETLQKKGNVVFLPITEGTEQIYHIKEEPKNGAEKVSDEVKEGDNTLYESGKSLSEEESAGNAAEVSAEEGAPGEEATEAVSVESVETTFSEAATEAATENASSEIEAVTE